MQRTIKSIRAILLAIVLAVGVFAATAAPVYAAAPTLSNFSITGLTASSLDFTIDYDGGSPTTGSVSLHAAVFVGNPGVLTPAQVQTPSGHVGFAGMLISTGVSTGYPGNIGAPFSPNTQYTIYVVAINDDGPSEVLSITFTSLGPPTITNANNFSSQAGTGSSFALTATGNPAPTWSLSGAPAGVTVSGSTLVIAASVPVGTYTFTITANNGVTPNATQSFTLTVTAAGGGGGGGSTGGGGTTGGGGGATTTGVSPKTDDATGGNMFLIVMMLLLAAGAVYTGRKAVKAKK